MNASRRIKRAQELLKQIGLEPERVQMFNLSSAMAGKFVASIQEMTEKVKALGLSPLHQPGESHEKLSDDIQYTHSALKTEAEVSQ